MNPSLKALHLHLQDKRGCLAAQAPHSSCPSSSSAGPAPAEAQEGPRRESSSSSPSPPEPTLARAVLSPVPCRAPCPDPQTAQGGVSEQRSVGVSEQRSVGISEQGWGRDLLTLRVFPPLQKGGEQRENSWKPLQQFRKLQVWRETSALIKNSLSALLTPSAKCSHLAQPLDSSKGHTAPHCQNHSSNIPTAALGLVTSADLREVQIMLDKLQRPRASQAVRL